MLDVRSKRPLLVAAVSTVLMGICACINHNGLMLAFGFTTLVAGSFEVSNSIIRTHEARIPAQSSGRR
jgi:hypothetical protein